MFIPRLSTSHPHPVPFTLVLLFFVNASMVHEKEKRKSGSRTDTETFCFQIRHSSVLAKTNCYCEKCDIKSPLSGATVKWSACVFSDIKPLSGSPPEIHCDPTDCCSADSDFLVGGVRSFLTSHPPGEQPDLLIPPTGDPLLVPAGRSLLAVCVELRTLV